MTNDQSWNVLESDYIVQDRWVSLRRNKCSMPNGDIVDPYYIFEYPSWVNILAVTGDQQIILIKQYRHATKTTLLEIPAGAMEPTDESPLAAAQRELAEETGYTCENLQLLGKQAVNPATHSNYIYTFFSDRAEKTYETQKLDPTEQIETILMPKKEFLASIGKHGFTNTLHTASLFLAIQSGVLEV